MPKSLGRALRSLCRSSIGVLCCQPPPLRIGLLKNWERSAVCSMCRRLNRARWVKRVEPCRLWVGFSASIAQYRIGRDSCCLHLLCQRSYQPTRRSEASLPPLQAEGQGQCVTQARPCSGIEQVWFITVVFRGKP